MAASHGSRVCDIDAAQQIVGRERRERVSQLTWCGGGCFDSRRRVNSTVRLLVMNIKTVLVVSIILAANPISFATSHTPVGSESRQKTSTRKTNVDVRYNKKTDITTVQLEELIIWKNPIHFEQVGMTFGFDYPKRTIVTPKLVTLRFLAATKDWDPFPVDDVDVMLDGTRFTVGKMEPRKGSRSGAGDIIEARRLSISYQEFSRIAKAHRVAILIGERKYDLTDGHLQLLRDFLELMQQEGQEFK